MVYNFYFIFPLNTNHSTCTLVSNLRSKSRDAMVQLYHGVPLYPSSDVGTYGAKCVTQLRGRLGYAHRMRPVRGLRYVSLTRAETVQESRAARVCPRRP